MIVINLDPRIAQLLNMPSQFEAVARSAAEAIACLKFNWPQFGDWLTEAAHKGAHFRITVGNQDLSERFLSAPIDPKVRGLRITLVPSGAGSNGLGIFQIVAGATLLGLGLGGVVFLGLKAQTIALTGAALLLQGISSFFGRLNAPGLDENNGKRSQIFGNPRQTVTEGGRVPVVYGVHLTGLNIVSAFIKASYTPA